MDIKMGMGRCSLAMAAITRVRSRTINSTARENTSGRTNSLIKALGPEISKMDTGQSNGSAAKGTKVTFTMIKCMEEESTKI